MDKKLIYNIIVGIIDSTKNIDEAYEVNMDTCLLTDIPSFDSLRALEMAVELEDKLQLDIELDLNLFLNDKNVPRSIREIIDILIEVSK